MTNNKNAFAIEALEQAIWQHEYMFDALSQRGHYKTQKSRRSELDKISGMKDALEVIKRSQ